MDVAILDAIQEHMRSPFMDAAMLLVTHLADLAILWLVVGVVFVAQEKQRRYGIALFLALLAATLIGMLVLKPLFHRLRPYDAQGFTALLIPPPRGDSFPSSHAMLSFAAATVICLVPVKTRWARALQVASVLAAALIAFSRLYLYVHYPTDVLAGALLGAAVGAASLWLVSRLWPTAPPADS